MEASTAETLTAIGTLIAAGGGVGALFFTGWAAKSAAESAEAANAGVAEGIRPLLLDVPREYYTTPVGRDFPWPEERAVGTQNAPIRGHIGFSPTTGTFSVPVRNLGRGPARITHIEMGFSSGGVKPWRVASSDTIPTGEEMWLASRPEQNSAFVAALHQTPSPLHEQAPLMFNVDYTDVDGRQSQRLALQLGSNNQDTAWRVLRSTHIDLRHSPVLPDSASC